MSETPLKDAVDKLKDLPRDEAQIGMVAEGGNGTPGDAGIAGEFSKDIGKPGGWEAAASGSWWVRKGWQAAAWLGWKGKGR